MNLSQILIEVFKTILQEEALHSKKKKFMVLQKHLAWLQAIEWFGG